MKLVFLNVAAMATLDYTPAMAAIKKIPGARGLKNEEASYRWLCVRIDDVIIELRNARRAYRKEEKSMRERGANSWMKPVAKACRSR